MLFRTEVTVRKAAWEILPTDRVLFAGSCFADKLGRRFVENRFRATVNPFGVMYNPVSILHTAERWQGEADLVVFTLGTNHVYVLKETGEVVDNCQKRPQRLFEERELNVDECVASLSKAVQCILDKGGKHVIVTVSPIRYAKYGYHGSKLSKATLLLAADRLAKDYPDIVDYFPAYEIVDDELRDYRFYKEDMLHPSDQAVAYIWEKFSAAYFGKETEQFLAEWKPIGEALGHRPFNPDAEEYRRFLANAKEREKAFLEKYNLR